MAKDYIYYCFLVNPDNLNDVLSKDCYYRYTQRYIKDNVIAKLWADADSFESIIEDFNPDCALIYSIETPITLFKGNKKIVPITEKEIEKCIIDQGYYLKEDSIFEYILSDTTLSAYDFIKVVKDLYVSNV